MENEVLFTRMGKESAGKSGTSLLIEHEAKKDERIESRGGLTKTTEDSRRPKTRRNAEGKKHKEKHRHGKRQHKALYSEVVAVRTAKNQRRAQQLARTSSG